MQSPYNGRSSQWSCIERRCSNEWYYNGRYVFSMPHRLGRLILAAVLLVLLYALLEVAGLELDLVDLWNSLPPEFTWSIDGRP